MNEFEKELESYFCRFTFGQFVTLILLEVVTLFFVFYLGAHYGPELLRSQPQKRSALPPDDCKKIEELLSNPPTDYSYPSTLTDHQKTADKPREDSKSIHVKPSGMTAAEAELLAKKGNTSKGSAPEPRDVPAGEPVGEPVGEPSAEPIRPVPEAAPSNKPTSSVGERFNIQLASYQNQAEADQMVARWKKKGYSAFVTSGEVPDKGLWYRVRTGRFKNRGEANAYLEKFKKREKISALVVSSKN